MNGNDKEMRGGSLMKKGIFFLLCFAAPLLAQQKPYIEHLETFHGQAQALVTGAIILEKGIAVGADDQNAITIFSLAPFKEIGKFPPASSQILAIPEKMIGDFAFAGLGNGKVLQLNTSTFSIDRTYDAHKSAVNALEVADDNWLIAGSMNNEVRMLSRDNASNALQKMPQFQSAITIIRVAPSKKYFVVGTKAGVLYVVEFGQFKITQTLSALTDAITTTLFSPDGKTLVAGSESGKIVVWETETFSQLATWQAQGRIQSFAIDPKIQWLMSSTTSNALNIFDLKTYKELSTIPCENGIVLNIAFLDEESFVTLSSTGVLNRWKILPIPPDSVAPTIVFDFPVHTSEETAAKFYRDRYVLSGIVYDDGEVAKVLLNQQPIETQQVVGEKATIPSGMNAKRFSVAVSPDSFGINRYDVECIDGAGNTSVQSFYINKLTKEQAVEIISPAPNAETELISVPLHFKAWFDVASYSVSVNLVDVIVNQEPGFDVVDNDITETIPLLVGYNQIQLTVKSKNGDTFTYSLGVNRKTGFSAPMASGEKKPRTSGSGPQRWAVIVGVSEYQNSGIPSLKYADKDAEALASFLQRPQGGGFDSDHMRVLLNKDATLANIKDALINFLSQAIDMDLVIIYFAGHGAPEPGRPQNMYLLTYDSNPSALGTTAFPMWDIQTVLSRYITAKRVVVFTDACHSGGISVEFATRGLGVSETNLVNQYLTDLSKSKEGIVVFTASAAGEVSQEYPEFGHGVFTYFLLQGMEGKADYNNDYTVTINELMQYVEEQVKRKTRGAQNPTRSQTSYDKDLTISVIPH